MFGAGVTGEGGFSIYENRDIELDPPAPVTAVLTVAYIPPEVGSDGGMKPRVKCFLVDEQFENRSRGRRSTIDGVAAVMMECAPSRPPGTKISSRPARRESSSKAAASISSYGSSIFAEGGGEGLFGEGSKERRGRTREPNVSDTETTTGTGKQPLRRSTRASTVAKSQAAAPQPTVLPVLSAPSTSAPVEDADTIFLVSNQNRMLEKTTAWLEKLLPGAVILGGISRCSLVIANQVRHFNIQEVTCGTS